MNIDLLEIVLPAPRDVQELIALSPLFRDVYPQGSGKVLPRERAGIFRYLFRCTLGDDMAPVDSRAGPHIHDPVCVPDRVLVVFHDDQGITQVPEPAERVDQLLVIPLVEPDGGLVEDVEDTHQVRTDLRCEPDSLGFSPREAACAPGQGEVPEADLLEEIEAGHDFLEDLARYLPFPVGQVKVREEPDCPADRHVRDVHDGHSRDPDRKDLFLQASAPAPGTFRYPHELFEFPLPVFRLGLVVEALGLGDEAFPFPCVGPLGISVPRVQGEADAVRGAVHEDVVLFGGEVTYGCQDREAVVAGDCTEVLVAVPVEVVPVEGDCPLRDRFGSVGDDEVRVKLHLDPEPVALLAGPERAVEGEHPGLEFLEGQAADGTGKEGREDALLPLLREGDNESLGLFQGILAGLGQAGTVLCIQPVDNDVDIVLPVPLERDLLVGAMDLAVDAHPGVALPVQVPDELLVGPLLLPHNRGEDSDRPPHIGLDPVRDPLRGLSLDTCIVHRAVGNTDPGEQEAQVIIDLGHRSDRAARVFARALLLDRDCRRETDDGVNIGLVHQAQELAGIGRE